MSNPSSYSTVDGGHRIGDLVHRITADVKTLARDELELAKGDFKHAAKVAAGEAAAIVLGGIVALIGLGMLCAAAVAALEPLIPALSLRLLLMAIVYLVVGGAVAASMMKRLKTDIVPDTSVESYEARRTMKGIKSALTDERASHA